jgi:hypothetical protein
VLAPHLPAIGDRDANGFLSAAIALLAVAALIVMAVPPHRHIGLLVAGGGGAAITAAILTAASAPEAASPFKALFAAAAGLALARFIFSPVIVYALAILAAGADVLSVSAGPTHYLINEQPRSVDYLTLFLPQWGDSGGSQLGISDLIFMAVFLETAWRFGLRRRLTAVALSTSLVASLAIAYWADVAVPALPLLSAGLLLPNADLVWSSFRDVVRR